MTKTNKSAVSSAKPQQNFNAVLLMMAGMTALATNDAILKLLGESFSAGQIMASRGIAVCVILFGFITATGRSIQWRLLINPWSIGRGLSELIATVCFISSLALLPLALATTIVFIAPVMLTLLSSLLYGEKVGKWRWLAAIGGFIGVAIVSFRNINIFDARILLPLATACAVVCRDICTRNIAPEVSTLSVTLTTVLVVTLGGLATLPFGWEPVSITQLGWICLAAIIICLSFVCYIVAIRTGELSLVAPVQYIVIVWALIYGFIFWSEVPDSRAVIGGCIIIASGLIVLWRESVRRASAQD